MSTFTVYSSNGDLEVYCINGVVKSFHHYDQGEGLDIITKFDIEEYKTYYNLTEIKPGDDIDILNIGYWYKGRNDLNLYEPPVQEARELSKEHAGSFIMNEGSAKLFKKDE